MNKDSGEMEFQRLTEFWTDMIIKKGASLVTSTFPKGEFFIGGTTVVNESYDLAKEFSSYPIGSSEVGGIKLSMTDWHNVIATIQNTAGQEYASYRPSGADVIVISDLMDLDKFGIPSDTDMSDIRDNMIGISFMSKKAVDSNSAVIHTMVLPKSMLKDITKAILGSHKLMKSVSGKVLSGSDDVVKRGETSKALLSVKVRKAGLSGFLLSTIKGKELLY